MLFWLTDATVQVSFNTNNLFLKITITTKLKRQSGHESHHPLFYSLSFLHYKLCSLVLRNWQ